MPNITKSNLSILHHRHHHRLTSIFHACMAQTFVLSKNKYLQTCLSLAPSILSLNSFKHTLAMSSYLSLYQPYLLPPTANTSLTNIIRFPLHISKPSQYVIFYNLKHWSNIHSPQQLIRCHSTSRRNTKHLSHHRSVRSLQLLYILQPHWPCLTTVHHHTLNACRVDFFLNFGMLTFTIKSSLIYFKHLSLSFRMPNQHHLQH